MSEKSRIDELVDDANAFVRCVRFVWRKRMTYFKYSVVGVILALIIAFSIPKSYSSSVVLAPEPQSGTSMPGLSNIASMAGIDMGSSGDDAYTIELYPSIVSSLDFLLDISTIKINPSIAGGEITYYDYLLKYTKRPWWSSSIIWVKSQLSKLTGDGDAVSSEEAFSAEGPRKISKQQYAICEMIKENVSCKVEELTGVISVTVRDQDSEVAAIVADSVVSRLNKFILDYRTSKARAEYETLRVLCDSARAKYVESQDKYVEFARRNSAATSPAIKAEMEFLQNEVNLAYNAYSTLMTQAQIAQTRIQETTPIYTVVEEGHVPFLPDSPRKTIIVIVFVFLACVVATIKLAYVKFIRKKNVNPEESDTLGR